MAVLVNMAALVGHADGPKLTLRVDPQVAFYPTPLRITTIVERRPENRLVVLTMGFNESRWEVQGDKEPSSMRVLNWKTVEPGEHTLVLAVIDANGRIIGQTSTNIKRVIPEQ